MNIVYLQQRISYNRLQRKKISLVRTEDVDELINRVIQLEAALCCLGCDWFVDMYKKGGGPKVVVVNRDVH